ncbi:hypothetical protein PGQ11_001294 [Apiospora arundinis]|uniref:Uncharacterized protein n=1 Tax=Apiospora arundinis TaxID=335852 RepID=A0ABR2JMN0_9PEZI
MFLALTNLTRLQLCKVCSSFFNIRVDPSTGDDVHRSIWYDGVYEYTRVRGEIEQEAASGCAFCESVFGDRRYMSTEALESGDEHTPRLVLGSLRTYELKKQQRPPWFPPLEETLRIQIGYSRYDSDLNIRYSIEIPAPALSENILWRCAWALCTTQGG